MTPEQTIKVEMWRAFFLGVRTAIVARGDTLSNDTVHSVLQKLDAVMRGDETLYDPASEILMHGGEGKDHVNRVQMAMRSDRDLAQEIAEGFHCLAAETKRT